MLKITALVALLGLLGGCAVTSNSASDDANVTGDQANLTSDATLTLTSDFKTSLVGAAKAGSGLRVEYALERLPQCRGNVGGGGPGWTITGFYSENGSAAKTFDVSAVSADGNDRVAKPARIALTAGGDLAVWFQVTSVFGCEDFDSAFGQNYHVNVDGPPPSAGATITFAADGGVDVQGSLAAGGKVKVHYEQARLSRCEQTQEGNPVWGIGGHAQINGGDVTTFDTGRPDGSDRVAIDAVVDLPSSGDLALWFDSTSISGCHDIDSKGGANYHFNVQ